MSNLYELRFMVVALLTYIHALQMWYSSDRARSQGPLDSHIPCPAAWTDFNRLDFRGGRGDWFLVGVLSYQKKADAFPIFYDQKNKE